MNMPGFTAEASLGAGMGRYGAGFDHAGSGRAVVSAQQLGAAIPRFTQKIRCCRYDPWLRRFICTERSVPAGYQCQCVAGFAVCKPLVLYPG